MDLNTEVVNYVHTARKNWENATCWVTDKVAFNMRNMIKTFRKNYWGIFDEPKDPKTGRDKIWPPLSETMVENVVKNIDLDTKDMNFRSEDGRLGYLNNVVKYKVRNELDDMNFGEALDEGERQLAIDGTLVWKTFKQGNKIIRQTIDLLNFYIDPTAESIDSTPFVIERGVLTLDEFKLMDGWKNKEDVLTTDNLHKTDTELTQDNTVKMVEVWELWGKIPKYFITNKKKDTDYVEGHLVVTKNQWHLIEINKEKIKPYEECRYQKVSGRWYGRGICEKVMWLQAWLNITVNIRIVRSFLTQMGLFKIKKSSGVTPQMMSRLSVNGAVVVNSMDDIENFVINDVSATAYNEENVINDWAMKQTSAYEAVTGEQMPSTTTATNGAIISRAGMSQFVLIKEGIGMFLQRWVKRQLMPRMSLKAGDIIKIYGKNSTDFKDIDSELAEAKLAIWLKSNPNATYDEILAQQAEIDNYLATNNSRYIIADENVPLDKFDVTVYVTNEEIDKGIMMQNLTSVLQMAPEYKEQVLGRIFDLMGLALKKPEAQPQMAMPGKQPPTAFNPNQQMQEANTL